MNHSKPTLPPTLPPNSLYLDGAASRVQGRSWLEKLVVAATSVSVSTKIMGIVLGLTILLGLGITLQVRSIMYNTFMNELHNQGISIAADLADRATALVEEGNVAGLEMLLRDTLDNYKDTRYALVLDEQGQLLAYSLTTQPEIMHAGDVQSDIPSEEELLNQIIAANSTLSLTHETSVHYQGEAGQIHDFATPIRNGELGHVRLGLAETRIQSIVAAVTDRMILTTLTVAGVGILAAMLLIWLLTRPILDLVATTQQLGQGNLSVRAPRWNDDEIGALADAFNQMVSELEISQQMVIEKETARTHLLSRLISAQEEERKRIARELHDGVGQALTSILVHIKVLTQQQDPATQARMRELHQLVDETLADVRLLSRELRPSSLDDLGLAAALERYVAEFGLHYPNLEIDLHCDLPQRLPPNLETSLYRVIQEAMTNSARHSHATTLSVVVTQRDGRVQAIIEDNGEGFDVESTRRAGSSVGLHSMSERSELLNGSLNIESSPEGTSLYVEIPIVDAKIRNAKVPAEKTT
jgi:signal transduction histidine kinase